MPNPQAIAPMKPATRTRLRVTVLRGGPSAEREVSLVSGAAVADALRQRGHAVLASDIGPDDLSCLDHAADVIFPVLHGTWGEDGALQSILEKRGVPFVGSGSQASALAMDKVAAKQLVSAAGIPTPEYEVVTSATLDAAIARLPVPRVVKPVDSGSSVATHIVRSDAELPAAIRDVVGRFGRALIEQFIDGDELTVGILGGQALPPICIRPKQGFYDYRAKYHADDTEYLFDAGLPAALVERVQRFSERIFQGVGCRHLARIDWMVDRAGNPYFLEVNTLPGFTSHSLLPKAAARVGIAFDELCERLMFMALKDQE